MTLVTYTYELTPGTPEDVSQVMANFNTIKGVVNGNLDNANLAAGAAIAVSKLAPGTNGDFLQTTGGVAVWAVAPGGATPVPTGALLPYTNAAAPTGFLLCDGAAVSRTTYAALFAVCGTTYGIGNGSTTFNVPDLRGRLPTGVGTHNDVNALGDSDGVATVGDRRPYHKHSLGGNVSTVTDHSHGYLSPGSGAILASGGQWGLELVNTDPAGGHSHGVGTLFVGPQTNTPTDAPAFLVFSFIIKT
jgi:microcystin-dependent protein